MREPNRIPVILKFFRENPAQLSMYLFDSKLHKTPELDDEVEKEWIKYPDLRLGQLLVILNKIKDGPIFNREETKWLIEHGYFKINNSERW